MATPKKIKCGKQRPRCARCVSKGLDTCHYSVSMRIGRPPRNRTEPVSGDSRMEDSAPSPSGNNNIEQEWPVRNDDMLFGDFGWTLGPDEIMATAEDIFDTHFSLDEDLVIVDTKSGIAAGSLQFVPPAPRMIPQPSPAAGGRRALSARRDELDHDSSPAYSDCLTSIVQLLDDMHVRNPLCSDGAELQHRPRTRSIDMVLMRNRAAVSTLAKAVDCPCFLAQGCIHLASYLLLSAVISGYAAILKSGDIIDGKAARASSIADNVTPRPMYVGSYELDEAAQRGIHGRIVLTELKTHLEPLLERLPKFRLSLTDEAGRAANGTSMPDLVTSATALEGQECVLREQLRSLVSAASQIP
ncbi:hypothetical protein CERZMDRAFT_85332 [Cercospora zeae-maydis SCOH1-5]|uniref:Zn(2)-C6 fungal-type domain-containing protein n=1 Tax=Cercospora zeae-maydis SCOH1-5 TaxID=717836 RepID=A0A6A6FDS5_9PEZI|nr:hypothetical protein CERZMDRAFT_85332 [Cercospora zeae-maydis SCOH1-5]